MHFAYITLLWVFYCVNCLMLQETGRVTMLPVNMCVGQATLGSRVNILVLLEHTD